MEKNINWNQVRSMFMAYLDHDIAQETYCLDEHRVYLVHPDDTVSVIKDVSKETWEAYNLLCGC